MYKFFDFFFYKCSLCHISPLTVKDPVVIIIFLYFTCSNWRLLLIYIFCVNKMQISKWKCLGQVLSSLFPSGGDILYSFCLLACNVAPTFDIVGLPWSWLYCSWIYNYPCNQCLSPLKLWVWPLFMARCTRYNIIW